MVHWKSLALKPAQDVSRRFQIELQSQFDFASPLDTTLCRDIQARVYGRAFDMTDDVDRQAFLDAGGHSAHGCPKVSAVAAQVAAEEIMRRQEREA